MTKDDKRAVRDEMTKPSWRKEAHESSWGKSCVNCFSTENIEYHHIVPLANGGNHVFSNIVPLCRDCHLKAHGKLKKVSDAKSPGRKPLEVPSDFDTIINKYLVGYIDRNEMIKELGFSNTVKLDSIKPYQDYLKERHIVKVKSNVARNKNSKRYYFNDILTEIYFDDGRVKQCRMMDNGVIIVNEL